MKLSLIVIFGMAWICLARASEMCIQDVKVVTPEGVFEEVKKEELQNGKVVRTETIRINKPIETKEQEHELQVIKDQERRRILINKFMKHFRMAKLLHSLLNNLPCESAPFEQLKPHPHPHHHNRIVIIRIPLTSLNLPFPASTFPSLNRTESLESSMPDQLESTSLIQSSAKESENTNSTADQPQLITTSSPPIQDQIPTPEVIQNDTNNEIS